MNRNIDVSSPREDSGALRTLLAYQTVLQQTATRILGCRDAARDAVQEALITCWLHPPVAGDERAWLIRTVIHRSLHQRRTRQRRAHWEHEASSALHRDCLACHPGHELEQKQLSQLLSDALARLPEPFRSVFVLREAHGWHYERIAQELALPLGTVRSRLNRARSALRAGLASQDVDTTREGPGQNPLPPADEAAITRRCLR